MATLVALFMSSAGAVTEYDQATSTRDTDGNWFSYTWVNQNDNGVYTYDELDAYTATQDSTLWSHLAETSNDISEDALLVTDQLNDAIKIIDASEDLSIIQQESTAVLDNSGNIIAFVNDDGKIVINSDQIAISNDNAERNHVINEEVRETNSGVSAETVGNVKDFLFDLAAKQGKEDFIQTLLDGGRKILDVVLSDELIASSLTLDTQEGNDIFSKFVSDDTAGLTLLGKDAVRVDVNSIITQNGFFDNVANTAKIGASVFKDSTVDTIDDCSDGGATDRKEANSGNCIASVINSVTNAVLVASAPATLGMSLALIPAVNIAVGTITDVTTTGSSVTEGATLDYLSDNGFVDGWSSDTLATDWYLKNRTNNWDGARAKFAELGYYTDKTATSNGTDYVIVSSMDEWAALGISDRFAEAERHFRAYSQVPENGVLMYAMSDLSDLVINSLAAAGDQKAIAHKAFRDIRQSEFDTHLLNIDVVESNDFTRGLNYGENSQAAKDLADQYLNGTAQQRLARGVHITDAVLTAWSMGWNGSGTTAVTVGSSDVVFTDIAFGADHSTAATLLDAVALGGDVLLNTGSDLAIAIEYLNPETQVVTRNGTEDITSVIGSRLTTGNSFTGSDQALIKVLTAASNSCNSAGWQLTRDGIDVSDSTARADFDAKINLWSQHNSDGYNYWAAWDADKKAEQWRLRDLVAVDIKNDTFAFTCNGAASQSMIDAGLMVNITETETIATSWEEAINSEDGIFQIVANDTILITDIDNNNADLGVRILNEYGDDRIANQMLVVGDLDDTAGIVMDQYVVDSSAAATAATASLVRGKFKNLTAARTAEIIKATATDIGFAGVDATYGNGKVNLLKALSPYNTLTDL